ncbi:MAG TPA: hypothetical protein VFE13_19595 [Caulobacteraceae bacterium]|jgi:hypothetical protein|nr:hypothetical protein [Caulobacteraceae bacterium]
MTPIRESLGRTRARFLLIWIVPIALAGALAFAPPVLNDGDTFWHVAAGRWIIQHLAVPATDPFSFTFAGHPWVAHEWLSEVLMAAAWFADGWGGVMLLVGLAMGLTALCMAAWLLRWMGVAPALMMLVLGLACVAPGMLARPHLIVLPLLAFWTVALMEARRAGRAPSLWLALLMVLWANLHSSFVVGYGLAAAFGAEALLDFRTWRRPTLVGWAVFLGLGLVATLATPHGIEGLAFPLKVLNMKTLPFITEWQSPDFMKPSPLEGAILVALFAAFWRGVRLSAIRAAILLGVLHMSLQHVRQEVLLGVLGPLLLAEPFGRALGRLEAEWTPLRVPWPQSVLGAGLLAAVIVGRLVTPMVRTDGPTAPISALAHTPPALRRLPVLNFYDFGGYLIFAGVAPYIDGRADMYGDAFVAEDEQIQRGFSAPLDRAIGRYGIRWAILPPNLPVVGALERRAGWRVIYRDATAVVLEKTDKPAPAPPRS